MGANGSIEADAWEASRKGMIRAMKIALAQINPTVGDLSGNRRLAQEAAK